MKQARKKINFTRISETSLFYTLSLGNVCWLPVVHQALAIPFNYVLTTGL